jgi:hypothetical protein
LIIDRRGYCAIIGIIQDPSTRTWKNPDVIIGIQEHARPIIRGGHFFPPISSSNNKQQHDAFHHQPFSFIIWDLLRNETQRPTPSPISMTAILFWTLLLLLQPVVDGIYDYRYRDFLQRKNKEQQQVLTKTRDIGDVEELYLSQRLDHFDHNNAATFQQRYVATNRYIIDDPVSEFTFLCVGGEGPGFDKTVLVDSVHCTGDMLELAKRLSKDYQISVHVYALEHRYYGSSYPSFDNDESPVTIQKLKYLSSRQALEDLAHFVHTINEQQGKESKWVTFGGSYPGFMAAYARLKYPHLIFAGVSSSAPLDLKVDFPGYNHLVGADLKYSKVGGSETCFNIVKKGHDQAIALSQTNPLELGKMFNVCQPENLHARRNQEILL